MFDVGFHVPHEIFELLGRIFTSIVILQNFDYFFKLDFNKSLKFHELYKAFSFLFHEVLELFSKHVIYEFTKYFAPPTKMVLVGPQMSKWINSNTSEAFDALSVR